MKIYLSLLLFCAFIIIFPSCTKTVTKTVTDTVTDTITKTVTNNSTLYLLTAKQWIVDSVYNNYTGPNTGTLDYVKGGSNNTLDYSSTRLVFWPNGTEDYFFANNYGSFPWSFQGSDSSLLLTINSKSDYQRIKKLNADYLTLYDSTNTALVYYANKP